MNCIDVIANVINLHLSFSREVQDLVNNGYLFLFDSKAAGIHIISLRHRSNGRKLTLILYRDGWCIKEKGKIIKEVRPNR